MKGRVSACGTYADLEQSGALDIGAFEQPAAKGDALDICSALGSVTSLAKEIPLTEPPSEDEGPIETPRSLTPSKPEVNTDGSFPARRLRKRTRSSTSSSCKIVSSLFELSTQVNHVNLPHYFNVMTWELQLLIVVCSILFTLSICSRHTVTRSRG